VAGDLALLQAVIGVPLMSHGELVAILTLGRRVTGGAYSRRETEMEKVEEAREVEARRQRRWSGSSAIRLSPPRIRACGFPALGSSRRLPNAGQGNLARVSDAGRRQWEAV
jgi:hypothetical protein